MQILAEWNINSNYNHESLNTQSAQWVNNQTEVAPQRCFYDSLYWKYVVNSNESTHNKVISIVEITHWYGCSVNSQRILRTLFHKNTCWNYSWTEVIWKMPKFLNFLILKWFKKLKCSML